jgi:hypothetical protein
MNKKLLLTIVIFITLTSCAGYLAYHYIRYGTFLQINYSPPTKEEIDEGKAVASLMDALPISANGFSITDYDYSRGVFLVFSRNDPSTLENDFNSWHLNSIFSVIPREMFQLISTANEGSLKD